MASAEPSQGVSLICWNVAGWGTTVANIRKVFGEKEGIRAYLTALKCDILLLQESKISKKKRQADPYACGVCDKGVGFDVVGWESFWCASAERLRGMNGVAAFVKKGLVHQADSNPFKEDHLNDEGRCLVLQFSHFVLFNVYVVNGQQGLRTDFKVEYLTALRHLMADWRAKTNLPVILAGDYNTTYRAVDCHWVHRRINMERLRDYPAPTPRLTVAEKEQKLDEIYKVLEEEHKLEVTGQAPPTPAYGKPRARVNTSTISNDAERRREIQSGTEPWSATSVPYVWVESLLKYNNTSSPVNKFLCHVAHPLVAGEPCHSGPDRKVFEDLLQVDQMVDTFVYCCEPVVGGEPGHVANTFTCFDQYRNKRFENEGNRIDYILVDAGLKKYLKPHAASTENNVDTAAITAPKPLVAIDEFAGAHLAQSISALTAHGNFVPAPNGGGGLPEADPNHLKLHLTKPNGSFGELPLDGIIFVPPQWSDHLAISTVLHGLDLTLRAGDAHSASTKECMFRYLGGTVRKISDFFKKKPTATPVPLPAHPPEPSALAGKRPRDTDDDPVIVADNKKEDDEVIIL